MRLDIFLYEEKMFLSREKSKNAVINGAVSVNGAIVAKPSYEVTAEDKIEIIKQTDLYVGRGGLKLEKAIEFFKIDLTGITALDIGACTGGFTDCMLKNGAESVCACDVGHGQLAESLRNDSRVINLEKTDIRDLSARPSDYGINNKFEFVTIDVSFISVKKILPFLKNIICDNARIVCLIKPQFETENKKAGKKGVIKDPKIHKQVCDGIIRFAEETGFEFRDIIESPIKGQDGNKEFLMLILN